MIDNEAGGPILNYLLGAGGLGGILWALYERISRQRVENAQGGSDVAEARANETLFNMLTKRLGDLESEVKDLRKELNREREYTQRLITMLVGAGLKPPAYPEDQ